MYEKTHLVKYLHTFARGVGLFRYSRFIYVIQPFHANENSVCDVATGVAHFGPDDGARI